MIGCLWKVASHISNFQKFFEVPTGMVKQITKRTGEKFREILISVVNKAGIFRVPPAQTSHLGWQNPVR